MCGNAFGGFKSYAEYKADAERREISWQHGVALEMNARFDADLMEAAANAMRAMPSRKVEVVKAETKTKTKERAYA